MTEIVTNKPAATKLMMKLLEFVKRTTMNKTPADRKISERKVSMT